MNLSSLKTKLKKTDDNKEKINIIIQYAKDITDAKRCSLFIYNQEKNKLQSIYNDGFKGHISLNSNIGLIGYSFHKRISIMENDTKKNPHFFKKIDEKLNYQTKNILAVPLIDSDHSRLGVIELLNKEEDFNQQDQVSLEALSPLFINLIDTYDHLTSQKKKIETKEALSLKDIQNKFDNYLTNKKLFLKEDGNAYYKILDMKREYFISANECYLLTDMPKKIEIYYYSVTGEFLSIPMYIKIHKETKGLQVSENINTQHFTCYPIEED